MQKKIDLGFAIGLEPEKAVEYFKSKGYDISWDWYETWQDAHSKSFTVAKAMDADILQDIRTWVDKGIKDGISLETFKKGLTPRLQQRGWWGKQILNGPKGPQEVQLGSPSRLETIYRTNVQTAYNAGRYKDQIVNIDDRPYWQYNAVLDQLTRPTHAAMNGLVFPATDPIWNTHYPPCGFNCRCSVRALTKTQIEAKGLKVGSSKGKLSTKSVEIAKGVEGEVTTFTGYGVKMAPDPGWSYNPGVKDWEPSLEKYEAPIVKEIKPALSQGGLAHRFPVDKISDITDLMQAYHEENPGIFHRGFKKVSQAEKNEKFFMATDSRGEIWLNDKSFGKFNPSNEFISALKNIKKGESLSFNQEYSVEAMWHEVLHNRAKGWTRLPAKSQKRIVMETLNQFVARHTYPDFLRSLGGFEAHGEAILTNGLGYNTFVQRFRSILKHAGINESVILDELKQVNFNSSWNTLSSDLEKVLSNNLGDKSKAGNFREAFKLLNVNTDTYFDYMIQLFFPAK